jgi:hypothetical protein
MAGGVAIILVIVIVVIAAILGIALYLTGGALWTGKTSAKGDRVEGASGEGGSGERRPRHKQASSPTTEHTDVVGAEQAAEDRTR